MTSDSNLTRKPHLVWVHPSSLDKLAASTWLEPTRELRRAGWEVTLVAAGPAGVHPMQGVDVLCVPAPDVYLLRRVVLHWRMLSTLRPQWENVDAVLFHHVSAPWLLPLRFTSWLRRKKCPLLVMDTRTVPMANRTMKDWLRGTFERMGNTLANWFAHGHTAITQRMAEVVRIPPERLWGIWPSGVDAQRFADAAHLRRWPAENEPVHLIYTGALHYERNLLTLCQAVVEANRRGGSFVLSLVGAGTHEQELRNFAATTNGAVRVGKSVPPDAMPELLAGAHVGVLPFPDEEKYRVCSPIKLFEYMGSGMPVLATRVVCHTDVIGDRPFCFWAEGADVDSLTEAILSIGPARQQLPEMGRHSDRAVADWTWGEAARKLREALEHGLRVNGLRVGTDCSAGAQRLSSEDIQSEVSREPESVTA